MCLYVALANVALGLRVLQLLVPKVLIMNFVCRLLQVLHVCPACVCVCVCVADLSVIPPNTVFQLIPHSGKLMGENFYKLRFSMRKLSWIACWCHQKMPHPQISWGKLCHKTL